MNKNSIEKIPSFKNIYELVWPAILSHATVMLIGITDLAFIARLPQATIAVAAAAIANNVCGALYSFLEGLRSGTTILVAQFFGAKNEKNITKILTLALNYAVIIGIVLFAITPILSLGIFSLMEKPLAAMGHPYLILRLSGLPFHLIIFAIIGLFRGLKNTIIPFFITLAICLFNILFNYCFMYGKCGSPMLGMNGIAIGSASAYFVSFLLSAIILVSLPISKKYVDLKSKFKSLQKLFIKIGLEIGLYSGIVVIALFLFVGIFIPQGSQIIAAHQIAFQVFLITYLFPTGFFITTSIIIGKMYGEHNIKKGSSPKEGSSSKASPSIKKSTHGLIIPTTIKIWIASAPIIGTVILLTAIFAGSIAHFFSPTDKLVAKLSQEAIYLICGVQALCSVFSILKGALSAVKDTRFLLTWGTITSYLIFLPLTYLLGIKLGYGIWGGYIAFLIWTALDDIIFGWRFFISKPWKK